MMQTLSFLPGTFLLAFFLTYKCLVSQVFGSVDEVDPIESEPKPKDEKPQPKIPNGTLPNCTSSPDSGHPSSRNFSVTSGLSDCSPSTEDASTQESGSKTLAPDPSAATSEVSVAPPTSSSLENKINEEPTEQSTPAVDAEKKDLVKVHTGDLASEDDMIKAQENQKLDSDAKDISKADSQESPKETADLNETSEVSVAEKVESTLSEKQPETEDTKASDNNEQVVQASGASTEEKTEALEGIGDSEVVNEPQENTESDVDKTEPAVGLEVQVNQKTPTKCDHHRPLTKQFSVDELKTVDTSDPEQDGERTAPEVTSEPCVKIPENEVRPPEPEAPHMELLINNPSDAENLQTGMTWDSDQCRNKALIKQMTEPAPESCMSIMSLSKHSPDMSDDSPSALEMEEITAALVYMPAEAKASIIMGPPLALTIPPEKTATGLPALELCMDTGPNTSPEGTESALSEEEPEMESLFPKPDSLAVGGDHKNDIASPVSSIGTTYSVSFSAQRLSLSFKVSCVLSEWL